ncbi:MAG TPA: hypothetical protein VED59_04205 [Acidimicrobiales bacterium]|nr:hypothetical protein [Acidimicrobiales bacterium]
MGAELAVACVWGGVAVYWLWTRRPSMRVGDSILSFRYELSVLQHATPRVVRPANRRRALAGAPLEATVLPAQRATVATPRLHLVPAETDLRHASPPEPVLAATRSRRRSEVRRRRRDVLCGLSGAVFFSLMVAVLAGSLIALCAQLATDLLLIGYVYMLTRTTVQRIQATGAHVLPLDGHPARALPSRGQATYGDFANYALLALAQAN